MPLPLRSLPVNRHRPLRRDEPTTRYLRLKAAPALDGGDDSWPDWYDGSWNYDDDDLPDEAKRVHSLQTRLAARLFEEMPVGTLGLVPERGSPELPPERRFGVEGALAARWLALPDLDADSLLREHAAVLRPLAGFASRHWQGNLGPAVAALLFAPFWRRSPLEWHPNPSDPARSLPSFVAHTFGGWPVPRFLVDSLHASARGLELRWVLCAVATALGASLPRLSALLGEAHLQRGFRPIARATAVRLLDVTEPMPPDRGFLLAAVLRSGGSRCELARLCGVPGYAIDPTSPGVPSAQLEHWEDTVRWLVSHRETLSDVQASQVLHWSFHRFTEEGGAFRWSGRTPESALRHAHAHREAVAALGGPRRGWRPRGWGWTHQEHDTTWTITELCTTDALHAESDAMRHCVRLYDGRCAQGHAAIFSLRRDGDRVLTIELRPDSGQVVQVRGACNRAAAPEEQAVVDRWHREVVQGR